MTSAAELGSVLLGACVSPGSNLPFTVGEIRIEETPTNTVVITRETFDPATCGLRPTAWPWRADMNINDF